MYVDAQNRPSNAQSLINAAGTYVSTDSIDLLSALDNPGRTYTPLRAYAVLTTATVGGTVQAQLISSASSNLGTPTVLASGPVLAPGAAGRVLLDTPMPDVAQQYLGFQYIITVASMTAGAVSAMIVNGTDRNASTIPMNLG